MAIYAEDFIDLGAIRCSCLQMITRDDCLRYNCKISPPHTMAQTISLNPKSMQNKTALAMSVTNFKCAALFCGDIMTQALCDNSGECVWNNNGVCENFQGCGSYQVVNKTDCALKSTNTRYCTFPASADPITGNYTCITDLSKSGGNYMTCYTLNDETQCNNYSAAVCTWRTFQTCDEQQSCIDLKYCIGEQSKDCADLSGFESKCAYRSTYCKWIAANKTCMEKECGDFTKETDCKSIVTDDLSRAKPCYWSVDGVCVQGFNLTNLNKFNCLSGSLNTSTWNEVEQRCQSCTFSWLLTLNLFLYLL